MLIDFLQHLDLKRSITTKDSYGQMQKVNWEVIYQDMPIIISPQTDTELANNPKFSKITHLGLYKGDFKDIKKHDKVGEMIVHWVVFGRNKAVLYLEELAQ